MHEILRVVLFFMDIESLSLLLSLSNCFLSAKRVALDSATAREKLSGSKSLTVALTAPRFAMGLEPTGLVDDEEVLAR